MDRKVSIAVCLLILGVCAWMANANPVESQEINHERVRRDINGLFDMIGTFFKKDDSGTSQAGNLLNSVFTAMGSLGKQMGATLKGKVGKKILLTPSRTLCWE